MLPADERLAGYRRIWEEKPVLREVYADLHRRIAERLAPGRTLELGGGCGNLDSFVPGVVSSDIVPAPWLDLVADAQHIPFADGSLSNIVMFDVLHHVERPALFLAEAVRVLRDGGRVVMIEPGITPVSRLCYALLHHEPVLMDADPLEPGEPGPRRDPALSNQAVPTLLLRHRERLGRLFPALRIAEARWISLFAYPLSGGFRRWSLLPRRSAGPLLAVERRLEPLLGRLLAFRLLAVLEKREPRGRHR